MDSVNEYVYVVALDYHVESPNNVNIAEIDKELYKYLYAIEVNGKYTDAIRVAIDVMENKRTVRCGNVNKMEV